MEEAGLRPIVETIKEDPEVVAEYLFLFRHNDGCD